MGRTIKLSISARRVDTDAPTVEDLLDQVRDYFDVLRGVEEAVAGDSGTALEWRIIGASKASPLALEVAAFSRVYATDIDHRAEVVTRHVALGMQALKAGGERPAYFTDPVLVKAQKLFERVTNGLDLTTVEYGPDLPELRLTPSVARAAAAHTKAVLTPIPKPYREIGSVEGFFKSVERDGWGRPLLWVRHRLTGDDLKCLVSGDALTQVEKHEIGEVWRNRRVQVLGTIHFKSPGRISQVDATKVRFLRKRSELPDLEDIVDPDFTGGLRSEDYLGRLRNGELS